MYSWITYFIKKQKQKTETTNYFAKSYELRMQRATSKRPKLSCVVFHGLARHMIAGARIADGVGGMFDGGVNNAVRTVRSGSRVHSWRLGGICRRVLSWCLGGICRRV